MGPGCRRVWKAFRFKFREECDSSHGAIWIIRSLSLDTGFERSKRKGFWPRLSDALIQNVTSRTRSGKRVLSAPIFIGVYAGSIIPAETWYPSRYSYKDGLRSGTYSLATGFGLNVLREFVIKF